MYVTASEFRMNVGKFIDISLHEDVFIVKHGQPITVLSSSGKTKQRIIDSLAGSYKFEGDIEEFVFKNRLDDYESLD